MSLIAPLGIVRKRVPNKDPTREQALTSLLHCYFDGNHNSPEHVTLQLHISAVFTLLKATKSPAALWDYTTTQEFRALQQMSTDKAAELLSALYKEKLTDLYHSLISLDTLDSSKYNEQDILVLVKIVHCAMPSSRTIHDVYPTQQCSLPSIDKYIQSAFEHDLEFTMPYHQFMTYIYAAELCN